MSMLDMTLHKIYLCETTAVLVFFIQTQFSEFNQMLLINCKCRLYSNKSNTELIFICEGCRIFFEERHFERFSFDELRKCLIKNFLKRSQIIVLPGILPQIIW